MSISYAPGTAFALVRPGVVVLLDDAVEPAAVSAVWAALERLGRPDGMADVLDSLTTVLDPSLRELPDFGVVVHESGPEGEETGVLHVVARGRVSVHLAGEVGSETIEAFGMTTWADKRFTDVDRYEIAVGSTGLEAALSLALTSGVVTARSVTWQRPHDPADVTVGPEDVAGTADDTIDDDGLAAVAAVAAGGADAPGDGGLDGGAVGAAPVADEGLASEPAEPLVGTAAADVETPDPTMVPVHPAEPDFARTLGEFPEVQAAAEAAAADVEPAAQTHDEAAAGAPTDEQDDDRAVRSDDEAAGSADDAARTGDGLDDDLEETVYSLEGVRGVLAARAAEAPEGAVPGSGPVPTAPEPPVTVDPAVPAGPVGPARPEALPPVPPPPPEPASSSSEGAAGYPGQPAPAGHAPYPVYQAAPQMPPGEPLPSGTGAAPTSPPALDQSAWPAPAPSAAPYPQGAGGSGPLWTVQLPGTPAAADEVAPAPAPSEVPTILARSCAYGHANTPIRSTCAVCGGGLNPQAEVVPRPSLGRLVLSTGDVVELEQPVVLGRYPQAHVVTAQAQAPRLVTVPSPSQDISRSHLEVRLEGWNVLLVDLTTVNGTTLLRPGQPPRRLHPQEPTLVMSGDVADLGDGVRLTFEGLA